ncbi:TraG/VirB4 family ATPase, partial [Mycobacterium tuberculosis]|uniref:TraG/VirB4 family ATPase n=1 Tax=Mycobacterium tuberculosis TaxID=1773 RepID=UPI0011152CC0
QLEALRQVSPVQNPNTENSEFFNKHHYGQVTFDSIAARTYPMTRGSFSDSEGIYFGRRTEDGGFCFLNLIDPKDAKAQNLVVLGKTGEGKSFFLKGLVNSLVDEGIVCFIFDLDGEWRDQCEKLGGIYIDQTTEEGRYFEPLTIMPKVREIDKDCIE